MQDMGIHTHTNFCFEGCKTTQYLLMYAYYLSNDTAVTIQLS